MRTGRRARERLTYANVMSSVAVFLVLGGGAAFAALGKNTVGTAQLKRNAVKVGKIAGEAVRAGKLAKNAIATNRLREGVVTTSKLGKEAVTGEKLAKVVTRTGSVVVPNAGSEEATANCQGNEQVVGAGTSWEAKGPDRYTNYVHVVGNGATGRGNQFTGGNQTFIVEAYCLHD
jgi:hypothetical protein